MALPGMRSTVDFGADERPKNWRQGLMLLEPRNGASLYALTAAMRSESTDDPEFNWWEEAVEMYEFDVTAAATNVATTLTIETGGTRMKPGDLLVTAAGEVIAVVAVVSNTSLTIARAVGDPGTPAGTAAAIATPSKVLYLGSAYREGAPRALGTSLNPVKKSNVTQIFRDPVEWTRTAMKTRLRSTPDAMKEDRRRAMHKHSMGIERAFWLGRKYETLEQGQPKRYTGGLLAAIPAANVKTVAGAGGALDMDELMSYFPEMFAYGSGEKLAYTSLKVLSILGEVVRKNTQMQWGVQEKEYGMNVKRLFTPAGTLVLTEHPAFGNSFLSDSIVVIDTDKFKYRYITDTTLLKDREDRGTDGKSEEYLTEAGLEIHHPETMFQLKGIASAKKDA